MILSIIAYRFPGLSGAVHTALRALLVAVALSVAVLVAVAPYLPQLMAAAFIVGGYAVVTYPKAKVQYANS